MTSHMKEVAKLLGVELEEEFRITGFPENCRHKLNKEGLWRYNEERDWWNDDSCALTRLLGGDARVIKLLWKPQKCAPYYIPCIVAQSEHMYSMFYWNDDNYDKEYYRMGLVCKTPEEAVALTKKMLAVAKEVENNG